MLNALFINQEFQLAVEFQDVAGLAFLVVQVSPAATGALVIVPVAHDTLVFLGKQVSEVRLVGKCMTMDNSAFIPGSHLVNQLHGKRLMENPQSRAGDRHMLVPDILEEAPELAYEELALGEGIDRGFAENCEILVQAGCLFVGGDVA